MNRAHVLDVHIPRSEGRIGLTRSAGVWLTLDYRESVTARTPLSPVPSRVPMRLAPFFRRTNVRSEQPKISRLRTTTKLNEVSVNITPSMEARWFRHTPFGSPAYRF